MVAVCWISNSILKFWKGPVLESFGYQKAKTWKRPRPSNTSTVVWALCTVYCVISEETKPSELDGPMARWQADSSSFNSSLSFCLSSAYHSLRLWLATKAMEGFDCEINDQALVATLLHSFDWQNWLPHSYTALTGRTGKHKTHFNTGCFRVDISHYGQRQAGSAGRIAATDAILAQFYNQNALMLCKIVVSDIAHELENILQTKAEHIAWLNSSIICLSPSTIKASGTNQNVVNWFLCREADLNKQPVPAQGKFSDSNRRAQPF